MAGDKWDKRFMELAMIVSTWSKDPSTRVGAVIADQKNRVVSVGFNGFARGVSDDSRLKNRAEKLGMVIHAEENALLFAGRDVSGMTIYVYPLPPCSSCGAKIIQSGIARVVAPGVSPGSKWFSSVERSQSMFDEAGVTVALVGGGNA